MKTSLRFALVLTIMAASLVFGSPAFAATDAAQLFKSKCSMCHGVDGKGFSAIHTPDFTSPKWQASMTNKEITTVITNGKKGTAMPAFGNKLKSEEIQALVHYLRSLNSAKKK
ncbi:MAG TPA: c-type cytochrome [Terriglobia bacterium]|nr:c-type cytochrome [Terriglobia bacterium]